MGRWSTNRRRGGGPRASPAAAAVTISTVTKTGPSQADVVFSGPVSVSVGSTTDDMFVVAGNGPTFVNTVNPTTVRLQFFYALAVGATWAVFGQPDWVITSLVSPESGLVM